MFPANNLDYRDRQSVCVKAHRHEPSLVKSFDGAILLVRNPYRSIVSQAYRNSEELKKELPKAYFKSEGKVLRFKFLRFKILKTCSLFTLFQSGRKQRDKLHPWGGFL